jgi:hypothetical protein
MKIAQGSHWMLEVWSHPKTVIRSRKDDHGIP